MYNLMKAAAAVFLTGEFMRCIKCYTITLVFILSTLMVVCNAALADEIQDLLKRMETAYEEVRDYQTLVEVKNYREDGSFEAEEFLYTLKKPRSIRLDFKSPHSGMIIV